MTQEEELKQQGDIFVRNFGRLGLTASYVKGIVHPQGNTFFFKLADMCDWNEKFIAQCVDKIAVFSNLRMKFGRTEDQDAHFKVDVIFNTSEMLSLLSIFDAHKIVLGKDTEGKVVDIDFERVPHLLVAGATGAGKSVLLKTLLVGLFYHYNFSPNATRFKGGQFIIIDPKGNEFREFKNVVYKYVDETSQAIQTLKDIESLMDYRYKQEEQTYQNLFVVIDELADLMLTSRFEVEQSIVRIAQKGRGCGIHLIVATQRPSVDVVSGLIKANMPSRMILKTASVRDSVVCLDHKGAEELLGNGDCIFKNGIIERRFKVAYPDRDLLNSITNIKR